MPPCGQHCFLEFLQRGFVSRHHFLPLSLVQFPQRLGELLAGHGVLGMFAIREHLQVRVWLLLIGCFFERGWIAVSQLHPPCIVWETMTMGAWTASRSSTDPSINVWVPPPDSPVQARRFLSTSGKDSRKSSARMLFQVCRPIRLMLQSWSVLAAPKERWESYEVLLGSALAKCVSL